MNDINEDLISRKALKEAINRPFWEGWEWEFICKMIDNAPIIETRLQGRWIYNGFKYRCSNCGKTPKTLGCCGSTVFMEENFKFCPNCGTKMKKSDEE